MTYNTHTHTHTTLRRVMLGLAGVPSLVMFFGLLFMPETPRWLVFHEKFARARKSLSCVCMSVCLSTVCVRANFVVCVLFNIHSTLSLSLSLSQTRKPEEVEPELQEIIADYQEYKAKKLGM